MERPDARTRTSTSSYRLRASPSASNPGPRFALVAGTRTRTAASLKAPSLKVAAWKAIGQARPRAVAAEVTSGAMVAGLGAPSRAQEGSFRPLPVIVHTTRDPAGIWPLALARSRPATLAEEASSPQTASWVASRR